MRLLIRENPDAVARAALARVLAAERKAIEESGMFRIALAGGSTPRRLYSLLAASSEPRFACWNVFFGDERWVPSSHPDSNARMARETFLDRVPIPKHQVHEVDTGAGSPEKAATLYTLEMRRSLAVAPGAMPRFDLILLGMGADGHTASLFPGSTALDASPRESFVATYAPTPAAWRLTMTLPAINAARRVLFVVSGADKAAALAEVLRESDAPMEQRLPAARVRPVKGDVTWIADEAAAGRKRSQNDSL